jgi:hypothetical protein
VSKIVGAKVGQVVAQVEVQNHPPPHLHKDKTMFKKLLLSALLGATAFACAADSVNTGDLAIEEAPAGIGKADHLSLAFEPVQEASVSWEQRQQRATAIITSYDSYVEYFGTKPSDEIDFDTEWVAYFAMGARSTGGYGASITGITDISWWGGLILETKDSSPGHDCIVTQAFTAPYAMVTFEIPEYMPSWYDVDATSETHLCSPTEEENQERLAKSLATWEEQRGANGNSYTYTSSFTSFTGLHGRTTFVVEDGVVVERHYKQSHVDAGQDPITWSEFGDEVGNNPQGFRPRLIDDLYAECSQEVLTQERESNWIDLWIDRDTEILRSCTYRPLGCMDDCQRGVNIGTLTF